MFVGPRALRIARLNSGNLGAFAKEVWRLVRCGDASPNTCFGKRRRGGEPKAEDNPSEGNTTLSTRCAGMMWADNCWPFSDHREKLICMVNDIIEVLLDLDMEPKLQSSWWTSTHKHEDMKTLRVKSRNRVRDMPFCEHLVTVFIVTGKDSKAPSAPCARH